MLTRLAIFFSIVVIAIPARAQWQPNGVVLNGGGWPQLVPDGSAGAFVTWNNFDPWMGQYSYAMAQAVDAAGNIRWQPGGKVLCPSEWHGVSQVVSDGNGGAIFVWLDNRNDYSDIFAQRYNSSGAEQWGACGVPVRVLPVNVSYDDMLAVSDGAGGVIIAWADPRSGNADLYAQHLNSAGTPLWTVNGAALCIAPQIQGDPVAIADGLGGAWVTWLDLRNADIDIYTRHINSAGTVDGPSGGLAVCTALGDQFGIDMDSDEAGGMVISWQDPRLGGGNWDIYAQRVNLAGNIEWAANGTPVCSETGAQEYPNIASDGAGGAIVAWRDWRSHPLHVALYAQRLNAAGQAQWTADGNLIATSQDFDGIRQPTIISEANGKSIVAWNSSYFDQPLSDYVRQLLVQRLDANGAPEWTLPGVELRGYTGFPGDGGVEAITLASDGWGGALVAWQDWWYWQASDVRVGHVSPGGVATDVTPARGPALMSANVYPNPFSGSAKLAVELTKPSSVSVEVFDVAGRKVRSFSRAESNLNHVVDLNDRDDAGHMLASGVYFIRVRAATGTVTRKIVITR